MHENNSEEKSFESLKEQQGEYKNVSSLAIVQQHKLERQKYQNSEYFEKMQSVSCKDFLQLQEKLKKEGFNRIKNFSFQLQKTIQQKTGNFYVFSASIGHYQTTITMLKINMKESFIPRKHFASGCYASIFTQEFENQIYVIKSQKITEESIANFDKKFDEILQEYFIYKLASILEFGPKMKNLYGFDIVCFNDSLEFSMELCNIQSIYFGQLQKDLLAGMKIMHTLQIVHRDIKNKNVAWSPTFKKWVFLDFGFSSLIQQKPGEKTFTSYRGTYQYSSKQLQSLYHLKTFGFIDLYQNDLHGMQAIKVDFFQQRLFAENSSIFSFMIIFCRMKKQVAQKNFEGIEHLFLQNLEFSYQFLKLITIELDRQKFIKNQIYPELYSLYLKLKEILTERNIQKNIMRVIEKEGKKYFNLFIEENQNSKSMWVFQKYIDLRKNIKEKWGQFTFMKELFIFFSETLFSNSKVAWKRMKLITDIIIKILIPNFEKRNWLWNFHYILQKFEEKFLEKKQFDHLKQIYYLYHFFNDRMGQKRLNQVLWENTNQGDEILQKMFFKLFSQIVEFRSIDACRLLFIEIHQIKKKQCDEKNLYTILEQIAELMLNFMLLKKNEKQCEELDQLLSLLSGLQEVSNCSRFISSVRNIIKDWLNRFSILFSSQGKVKKNKTIHISQNKYILLSQILDHLHQEMKNSWKKLLAYFKAYPLLEEIPNKLTFFYNLRKQNFEKINQISENIISFNKHCLEEIIKQLQYLHSRWDHNNQDQLLKEKKSVLKFFLASFKNRLSKDKVEIIEKFWEFYSMSFRTDDYFANHLEVKKQVISSISYLIEFFSFQDLSVSNKIYIHLFISLKMFLEGTIIGTDEFLEQLEKNLLIEELKENKKLLCDFIRIFPFFQNSTGKYYLHRTKLFDYILSTKMRDWLFYQSPLFFSNTITAKVLEKRQNEAFDFIISQTKYLSSNELINGKAYYIFDHFIKLNNEKKLQMMFFFLQSGKVLVFRENNYLSSFILMIYLLFESEMLNQLKFLEIKRVYMLSVISIDKFPEGKRINLRKMLSYKFRDLFKQCKLRKKRILNRQEDYSRSRLFFLKKQCQKMIEKKQIFSGKIKMHLQNKFRSIQKNLRMTDFSSQSKLKIFDFFN